MNMTPRRFNRDPVECAQEVAVEALKPWLIVMDNDQVEIARKMTAAGKGLIILGLHMISTPAGLDKTLVDAALLDLLRNLQDIAREKRESLERNSE